MSEVGCGEEASVGTGTSTTSTAWEGNDSSVGTSVGTGWPDVSWDGSGSSTNMEIGSIDSDLSNPRRWRTFYIKRMERCDWLLHRKGIVNVLRALHLTENTQRFLLDITRHHEADFIGDGAPGLQSVQIQNNVRIERRKLPR